MTSAERVIESVEAMGGTLSIQGERIRCRLPEGAAHLVDELRANREEINTLLRERKKVPPLPQGMRLVRWHPKTPPVGLVHIGVVTDVPAFVRSTLCQLDAALRGNQWLAGHWTVRELVDRLEQCGVIVRVESKPYTSG